MKHILEFSQDEIAQILVLHLRSTLCMQPANAELCKIKVGADGHVTATIIAERIVEKVPYFDGKD